ncbi:MAG: Gfo/Idh/MocA family oxidoreductase [Deinococcota bacterium]|nr:Gfo/Idh/MocA family oxidoreductase [Deinococcota bacterium]
MSSAHKVGIIGAGGVSIFHFQGYTAGGAVVVAIADTDPVALARRQREWNIPRGYSSYEELLADPDIEAVSVCLPNALHHPVTLAAARAGKHVLCEKPISLSLEKAEEMIRVCREAGVILQIGHHLRSDSAALRAKKLLDSGELGRLTFVRLRQAHDWAGAKHVRDSFGKLASSGGGTLLDNGCHMMDLARFFGGDVQELFARTATLGFDIEVEDTAVVTLTFASGALGSVENAWTATGWENGFWLYGTEGALEYTNRTGVLTQRFRTSQGTGFGDPDISHTTFGGLAAHEACLVDFLAAIRGERGVVCTGEDGLEATRLVLAAYKSAQMGQPTSLVLS